MDTEYIKCEVKDHIALVTMDRPPVNAIDTQFQEEMMLVFDTLSDLDEVRVAVLTGAGRAFSAEALVDGPRLPSGYICASKLRTSPSCIQ